MKNNSKKTLLQKMIEDINENWFSFFSGILANIPISLLLTFQRIGETAVEQWLYTLQWIAFAFSVVTVICAFSFTIKKVEINKNAQKKYEQWVASNNTQSLAMEERLLHDEFLHNVKGLRRIVFAFIVFTLLTVGTLIAMWILYS